MDPRQTDREIADEILAMARAAKPGDRWSHERPARNDGPVVGVREPSRPKPDED
jgi:hypothetical protein